LVRSIGVALVSSAVGAPDVEAELAAPASSPFVPEPIVASQLFAAADVSPATIAARPVTARPVAESASASSNLLLLDAAWAELDGDAVGQTGEDEVWTCSSADDESISDMALAAVLDESWWNGL
jgi:hypothetical protein